MYSFMLTLLYRQTRQNSRYVFLYIDSAIQADETRQQIGTFVFLYVDSAIQADETRQQIGIPLC